MADKNCTIKCCSKCGEHKPVNQFGKHAGTRDGLRSQCKSCKNIANAAWQSANLEKAKSYSAKWRAANPEKHKAVSANWRSKNPEKRKLSDEKWRSANQDKYRETSRANSARNRAANPEACRIHVQNRRARKLANGGRLSPGLAEKLFKLQRGKCACGCKQPLGTDYHMDHIMPLALGGSNEDWNIQLLRSTCNQQKHARHPIDFMQSRGLLL